MFARELEIIGAGALGGLLKRKARHAPAPGTPCANCATPLEGPYCHACGQPADDHHRSLPHLAWEGIEGLTHLDGRLAQTLPALFFHPGKLARDQFEGRRQRHVPPFRLFLVALLVFMFVLEGLFHGGIKQAETHGQTVTLKDGKGGATNFVVMTPEQAKSLHVTTTTADPSKPVVVTVNGKPVSLSDQQAVDAAFDMDTGDKVKDPKRNAAVRGWLKPRLRRAVANKDYYLMVLFTWAHRLAFLLLPILAGLLALGYLSRRKKFYIYDHLIVAMQFLSFVFLISALAWILPEPARGWAVLVASIWAPINLYQTLRGGYGSGRLGAVVKTGLLWTSTLFLFGVLMVGLMTLALAQM
ncbi:DUF3667 domain-containing protein [Phenylobacterium sp.]|uniref:DUF3667 domain-containing protein n=1 Tax=Phenylobacterium sp. TaxID=1871053 RepID=UPI002DE27E15|nr:DUF3667 domain-containing protein [Phenylobacterium sp.]